MNILVTGANGFVGKNLVETLKIRQGVNVTCFDIDSTDKDLDDACKNCDVVINLAGVNRTQNNDDFKTGNLGVIEKVVASLKKYKNKALIIYSSSIQAALDNPYGQSKKAAEEFLDNYSETNKAPVVVFRFPNLFGKWSRPNYNSVIATFCYNVARGLPIVVNDESRELTLAYIDDVVESILEIIDSNSEGFRFADVNKTYTKNLGEIASLIQSFKALRENKGVINTADEFEKKLYSTYLSFLPEDGFSYPVKMNCDNRGSFTELFRTPTAGQFSVNIIKPGITKGNHWHHTKNEKFIVVKGEADIKFRKVGETKVISYHTTGDKIEIVDIPCGYTHNIANTGVNDCVCVMWCNECFDPDHPDTFFLEV